MLPSKPHFVKRQEITFQDKALSSVKFSANGELLASTSGDSSVCLFTFDEDLGTISLNRKLQGHSRGVSDCAWSSDSLHLATASDDKQVRLWDTVTGQTIRTYGKPGKEWLKGHDSFVMCVEFSHESHLIASGGYDEKVIIWDSRVDRSVRKLPAHSDPVTSVSFIPNDTLLASSSYDGTIRLWDTTTFKCFKTLAYGDSQVPKTNVQFVPNGRFLLCSSLDSCIRLWRYVEDRCGKTLKGHQNTEFCCRPALNFLHGSNYVIGGSETGSIHIWDLQSRQQVQCIEKAHDDVVVCVDSHPTSGFFASCAIGVDCMINVWKHVDVDPSSIEETPPTSAEGGSSEISGGGGDVSMASDR